MAILRLPALHKGLVSRDNPCGLLPLRSIAAGASADATLALDRASVLAHDPAEVNGHALCGLRFWTLGDAEAQTINILACPKGGGIAEILWAGSITSGVAMPTGIHPITGASGAGNWFEIESSVLAFSKGLQVVDEFPLAADEVAGYPKSFLVWTRGAELLAVHVASLSAAMLVGIEPL